MKKLVLLVVCAALAACVAPGAGSVPAPQGECTAITDVERAAIARAVECLRAGDALAGYADTALASRNTPDATADALLLDGRVELFDACMSEFRACQLPN